MVPGGRANKQDGQPLSHSQLAGCLFRVATIIPEGMRAEPNTYATMRCDDAMHAAVPCAPALPPMPPPPCRHRYRHSFRPRITFQPNNNKMKFAVAALLATSAAAFAPVSRIESACIAK
jgi:hypothetical protein